VQVLSTATNEPWLRLLSYQPSQVTQLSEIARSGLLEPHPVSGEIEVDWDSSSDVQLRFKKIDGETLWAMVILNTFNLFFRLVYCTGDKDGGGDGWRVGEVGVANPSNTQGDASLVLEPFFGGSSTISEAEHTFKSRTGTAPASNSTSKPLYDPKAAEDQEDDEDDEDDDDDYWDRYDATPARTPAVKRSPAPQSLQQPAQSSGNRSTSAEDAYFAQYDSVQPALDNHDPDEAAAHGLPTPPAPLGLAGQLSSDETTNPNTVTLTPPESTTADLNGWTLADPPTRSRSSSQHSSHAEDEARTAAGLLHPRPASSASSNSASVAKLEEEAARRDQSEFGVKQHVSRSIRSLFLLSRASGIDREEFERMVRTELDVLGMVEDDI
jgi:hypothetical protein